MQLSRRQVLTAAGAALVLAACGGDDDRSAPGPSAAAATTAGATTTPAPTDATATTGTPASGLSFTDDRGETVTFDAPPTRIVAWQTLVPALVELGITPVGVIAFNDLATNPGFVDAGVDTSGLVAVSTTYGEVDIEALAGLQPDVILTYTLGDAILQGFTDESTQALAGQVAPFIAMDSSADVETGIARMEELAAFLGADLQAPDVQEDAAAFDAAVAELQALIADRPDLRVAFGGPAEQGLFLAPIDSYPELQFYGSLGLDVLDGPEDAVVSWELAPEVDADVFMLDDRTTPEELAAFDALATWTAIPAVAAGQDVVGWRFLLSYSRAEYARTIERLLAALRGADDTVA
jgi:iron complex transport system substrate-binding protein